MLTHGEQAFDFACSEHGMALSALRRWSSDLQG